jgi:hypothetical protein
MWKNIATKLALYCNHTGKRNKSSREKDGKTSCSTTVDETGKR